MFPEGFVWGSASSAYQIEGGARQAGRGESVWDTFCRVPGAVKRGHTGDVACDHLNRVEDDVKMMRDLGIPSYRFSVSWTRVMPEGIGAVNQAGLAFYDKLVDLLLEHNITPWLTLFHWDYPHALQRRGGWLNPDSPKWFADYTRVIVDRLSDRVSRWMTINEPQIFIGLGHGDATQAPGLKLPVAERLQVGHNVLLSHGRSVQVIRAHAKLRSTVGWAPCARVEYPVTETAADIDAARKAMFAITKRDSWNNTWWADPVCLGHYPEDGLDLYGKDAPTPAAGDMETIKQPLDFYGVNIYSGEPVRAGREGLPEYVGHAPGNNQTAFGWPVTPESLYWGPKFLAERYKLPVYITENGLACLDWVSGDGKVHDPQRIEFTRTYLLQLARAAREGSVKGYFHWSIMDNFEWAEGYQMRFGLVHVDFVTQKRTPKDSAHWFSEVIASNGANLNTYSDSVVESLGHSVSNGFSPIVTKAQRSIPTPEARR